MKKIKIDKEKCIGCGTCAALCPEAFELGSDFKAIVKDNANPEDKSVMDAIKSCPVEAISIEK